MKPFVDIEGSGQTVSRIASINAPKTIVGSSDAEIRSLSVECTMTSGDCIYNEGSLMISNVSIIVTGPQGTGGVSGIKNVNSSPIISGVYVYAIYSHQTRGISNINATPVITDSDIYVVTGQSDYAYGIFNQNSDTSVFNTRIVADGTVGSQEIFAIYHSGATTGMKIANCALDVLSGYSAETIYQNGGSVRVSNTLVEGSGEGSHYAGGAKVYGGTLELSNVTVAIRNLPGNIEGCDLLAYNTGATLKLNSSTLNGANWHAFCSKSGAEVYIGNSKINGGSPYGGYGGSDSFIKCIGSYDDNYDPFTCTAP